MSLLFNPKPMKHLLLLLFSLFIPAMLFAQDNSYKSPYQKDWQKVDSLMGRGLPQSARGILNQIYAKAQKEGQQAEALKAQLYLMQAGMSEEDAYKNAIQKADSLAQTSAFPFSNIWQSIAGEMLWNYYNRQRWQILNRTALAENESKELDEWDAPKFFAEITHRYQASLNNETGLVGIRIESLLPVVGGAVNTRNLRPTLYDLLAFRALNWFENNEKELPKPTPYFILNDAGFFAPAKEFVNLSIPPVKGDEASLHYRALKIYQQILRRMEAANNVPGLLDADLARLNFVYQNSVLPDKKDLYWKALAQLAKNYPQQPQSAEALYRMAWLDYGVDGGGVDRPLPRREPQGDKTKKPERNLPEIRERLKTIIQKYPNTEGAAHAAQLLAEIESVSVALTSEEVVLPGEASKVLVHYKNTPKLFFRLVRLNENDFRQLQRGDDATRQNLLRKASVVKNWQENMPGVSDFESHTAEVKVDAVPTGFYAVLASENGDFNASENVLQYVLFQASNIAFVLQQNEEQGNKGFILHRKSGYPLQGAKLTFYQHAYNKRTKQYGEQKAETITGNSMGEVKLPTEGNANNISITYGDETLLLNEYFSFYTYKQDKEDEKTFLFTDRSIYRPGQTIYFKGIIVGSDKTGRKHVVVPGEETEVSLTDANGQEVKALTFVSNEFGSFSGSFIAPSGLTGTMTIEDDFGGEISIQVEEYKRPKFKVDFDTLKAAYALNETAVVNGQAMAYAGYPLDGATVKYRVVREARWPFWWFAWRWGGPTSEQQEITQGTATTDANGKFSVSFPTVPDPTVPEESLPVFRYTVYADVTDINGETHSGQQALQAGYRSVSIQIHAPHNAGLKQLDTIRIATQNLNGEFVPLALKIAVQPLVQPEVIYKERRWERPDQNLMDSVTFRQNFPLDEFGEESDFRNWPEGKISFQQELTTSRNGIMNLPKSAFQKNGYYVITATGKDPRNGKAIEEKAFIAVWDKNLPGQLMTPLSAQPTEAAYQPGQKAAVHVLSAFQNARLLEAATYPGDVLKTNAVDLANTQPYSWNKTITEDDRGGIALQWLLVKENRVYTQSSYAAVPWSNKELDISWETHRDKLLPGAPETWTLVVRGSGKEKVAAELAASLYDASLDALLPHDWRSLIGLFPTTPNYSLYQIEYGFGSRSGMQLGHPRYADLKGYDKAYDMLQYVPSMYYRQYRMMARQSMAAGNVNKEAMQDMAAAPASPSSGMAESGNIVVMATKVKENTPTSTSANAAQPLRKNLQELAFFRPDLKTDAEGNVRISFTMPEALTEWKLLAFAHTKDLKTSVFSGTVKTQKDLMVTPGLPRFLRQNDAIEISTKISNLSNGILNGTATLEIIDANTLQPLNTSFRLSQNTVSFTAKEGGSTVAKWLVHVPESRYEPVLIRISAQAGNFTDGEENMLPVLSNRMLVTETLPLWVNGPGAKNFTLTPLLNSANSNTLSPYALTVEYTANPAWYAVQALPYLMDYPYECSEQTFNRYYANALAGHIVKLSPKVEAMFRQWEKLDTAALISNLEKNQELKTALLEETPWVLEAKNETEQKHRIATLFETSKLSRQLSANLRKLEEQQLPEGAWPWFRGDRPDRYITQYIVTGLGRLQKLGVEGKQTEEMLRKAVDYLDRQIVRDYEEMLKRPKVDTSKQQISALQAQYLYMRSFFGAPSGSTVKAFDFYKRQAAKYYPAFRPQTKAMTALALNRLGDGKTANLILQSLSETSVYKEEMGRYWVEPGFSYWWMDAPIETQSVIIEAFSEIANDTKTVNEAKRWLLKNKQTNNWESTKATADACYALLLRGADWLQSTPEVKVNVGSTAIQPNKTEAGTGYFKERIAGKDITPEMGNVTVQTSGNIQEGQPTWGAVYFQYFEDMDKIAAHNTPLALEKQLFIKQNTPSGPRLAAIKEGSELQTGDRVTARIILRADRDMEYIHLKDMRAACFEPVNVLSGYRWQGGLGYYESTRDASSNFFISFLPKGNYVFEYDMTVTNKGQFSNGIATIQCMYAPEFSAHSKGIRVEVK